MTKGSKDNLQGLNMSKLKVRKGACRCSGLQKFFRPEGPVLSSHVREGVERNGQAFLRPEGATASVSQTTTAPSALVDFRTLIHALTDVATECRPFGPESRSLSYD